RDPETTGPVRPFRREGAGAPRAGTHADVRPGTSRSRLPLPAGPKPPAPPLLGPGRIARYCWSGLREVLQRIDGLGALAQLEVKLRRGNRSGSARPRDDLAAAYRVAALDQKLRIVGVGGNPSIGMLDQNEVAVSLELIAGIDDHTVL